MWSPWTPFPKDLINAAYETQKAKVSQSTFKQFLFYGVIAIVILFFVFRRK